MKLNRPGIVLTLIVAVCLSIGCSKDNKLTSGGSGNQLLTDPLLLKLPTSAAGFAIFDLGGEGYKLFKNSPYGKTANAQEVFEGIQSKLADAGVSTEIQQIFQKLFDACGKMGLVSSDGMYTPEKVLRRTVFFAGPSNDQNQPLDFGVFSQAAAGVDLTKQFKILKTTLEESGLETTSLNVAGGEGFSASLKEAKARVFFGANSSVFGASLSQTDVEGLLSKTNTSTLSTIQGLPEYSRAVAKMPGTAQPLMFAFASLRRLEPLLDNIAKLDANGQFKPKEIPLEAIVVQSSFPKEYVHNVGLAITPRTDNQTKLVKALESSTLPSGATQLPSDTAFALSVDPRFLRSLDSVMNELKNSGNPNVIQQLELVQGITVGLRNNSAGAPIPDILMSIDSSNRESLNTSIESSLSSLLSIVGQAASWQTKEIAGNPTRFFSTLIGAGVYMSSPKSSNTLMLGTSEGIIKDLAASKSGQGQNFMTSFPAAVKDQLTQANVGLVYLNFSRIADVLDSVKSTLAMFTGGNSELNDLLNAANIRSWGLAAGGISSAPGAVMINASMHAPGN
jgi:hypothetical protein